MLETINYNKDDPVSKWSQLYINSCLEYMFY